MELIAYGSVMYILGLLSCAILVWFLISVTSKIKIDPGQWRLIKNEIQKEILERELRHEARMCIQQYCGG